MIMHLFMMKLILYFTLFFEQVYTFPSHTMPKGRGRKNISIVTRKRIREIRDMVFKKKRMN